MIHESEDSSNHWFSVTGFKEITFENERNGDLCGILFPNALQTQR
jgi:hypothetical protein